MEAAMEAFNAMYSDILVLDTRSKNDFETNHFDRAILWIDIQSFERPFVEDKRVAVVYGTQRDESILQFVASLQGVQRVIWCDLDILSKMYPFMFSTSADFRPGMVYPSHIHSDGLFLSSFLCAGDEQTLEDVGIQCVVNVSRDLPSPFAFVKYLRVAVDDDMLDVATFRTQISKAVDWIDDQLSHKSKVLVHCARGQSRSPTICVAWLMLKKGMRCEDAITYVKKQRPIIRIQRCFVDMLTTLE